MTQHGGKKDAYAGFEQGPIRPPSEAHSLLIRVTRNCPWNRCTFCPVYKGTRFSMRPVEHVKRDVDSVHRHVQTLRQLADESGRVSRTEIGRAFENVEPGDQQVFNVALNWAAGGMRSVFLQDANSLVIKPARLVEILTHIKMRFPWVERLTSYARSHTLARIKDDDMKAIRDAGLDRIHVGLESGSDKILEMVAKGATKEMHVKAGQEGVRVPVAGDAHPRRVKEREADVGSEPVVCANIKIDHRDLTVIHQEIPRVQIIMDEAVGVAGLWERC